MSTTKSRAKKKGMALANTVVLLTIIVMLSGLMLSLALLANNNAALSSREFERRAAVNQIYDDAVKYGERLLIEYQKLDANGNHQIVDGKPLSDYVYADGRTDTIVSQSNDMGIKLTRYADRYTLVITNAALNETKLTVVYTKPATGEVTVNSWRVG